MLAEKKLQCQQVESGKIKNLNIYYSPERTVVGGRIKVRRMQANIFVNTNLFIT